MFQGSVLWRGIVYTVLMMIGKLLCGMWLMRSPLSFRMVGKRSVSSILSRYHTLIPMIRKRGSADKQESSGNSGGRRQNRKGISIPLETLCRTQVAPRAQTKPQTPPAKPLTLYPAGIISFAMVARGEIGFLISAVAESNGVFQNAYEKESSGASELFLIVTWAIVLCTSIGPIVSTFCVIFFLPGQFQRLKLLKCSE